MPLKSFFGDFGAQLGHGYGDFGSPLVNGYDFNDFLAKLPANIGRWIGKGVNAYTESSTEFERDWNSPANQMAQYAAAGVNPYEGFLSGSGGNGNPISSANADPLGMLAGYLSNFISLAHGLADLRAKKIANNSSEIDLLRKQFENKWFFGDPGTIETYETTDANGTPMIVTEKRGYIQSKPERDYEGQITQNSRSKWQGSRDKYDSAKYNYGLEMGFPFQEMDYDVESKYHDRLDKEWREKMDKIEYEWSNYLKGDLGVDPHAPWWLTTMLNFMRNQAGADNGFGRALFGLLKFLKGDY